MNSGIGLGVPGLGLFDLSGIKDEYCATSQAWSGCQCIVTPAAKLNHGVAGPLITQKSLLKLYRNSTP
jgi:hypothetical protein